jgi:uncharacterized repeat protein (TIGR02543 family)
MKNLSKLWGIVFLAAITFAFFSCKQPTNPKPKVVAKPTATPIGGNYTSAQTVTLTSATTGAAIRYTLNGTEPTASSTLYSSPITVGETTTLKAIATKTGWTNSEILSETYTITLPEKEKAVQPTATPAGGNYTSAQTVTLTTSTEGAEIRYTLNGTTPTTSSTLYSSAITISATTTLKAIAVKTDMTNSDILTETYTITLPIIYTVTFNADGGTPAPSPVTVDSGSTITEPPAMTKAWHTFDKWYTDSARTVPAAFPITVNRNVTLYAKWTVIVTTLTNITDVEDYLASVPYSFDNPANLIINIDLGTMTETDSGWRQLLATINTKFKYVNLDLSACTMNGTLFNPDSSVSTGKNLIFSIVLPDVAESIASGTSSYSTFNNFTSLKSISGELVTSIDDAAFEGCTNLQNVNFPLVTSIGRRAFFDCRSLQSVVSPGVTNIGKQAFYGCTGLQSVDFPLLTSIDEETFCDCTSLQSVSFPQAISIGDSAFNGCTSLQSVDFPLVTNLVNDVFHGCTALRNVNFPQVTSIGQGTSTGMNDGTFSGCTSLQSASFPQATSIRAMTFYECTALRTLDIPKITSIGNQAFGSTGTTALSITMGSVAPTLGYRMFSSSAAKTVTVKIPTGATGYSPSSSPFTGTAVTVSGTNTTANWGNGLRGGGWNGTNFTSTNSNDINQNISLTITQQQ